MEERVTCAKIAKKYGVPQWAVYQVAHFFKFNQKLAHYNEATAEIMRKRFSVRVMTDLYDEIHAVYHREAIPFAR